MLMKLTPACQFHQHFMRTFFVQNFGAKTHKAECIQRKAAQFASVQKMSV